MKKRNEEILKAHAAITHNFPAVRDWAGLTDVLEKLWEDATQRAAFDHQMAVLAYRYAQAIERIGPPIVAERIGISVEELSRRIHPDYFEDITMSELRLLSIAAELVVEYEVVPLNVPPKNEGD